MITEEKDGPVFPVFILNLDSNVIAAGLINNKGYEKTIERGEAWLLNGESGKLLPDSRIKGFKSIVRKDHYVEIRAEDFVPLELVSKQGKVLRETLAQSESKAALPLDSTHSASPEQPEHASTILVELEDFLRERKQSMPEGSYTKHLFEQGEEKIRKKTGEEAVELLLAQSNEELISETADLLYHILVLFVERGISFSDALHLLYKRH